MTGIQTETFFESLSFSREALLSLVTMACEQEGYICTPALLTGGAELCTVHFSDAQDCYAATVQYQPNLQEGAVRLFVELVVAFEGMEVAENDIMTQSAMEQAAADLHLEPFEAIAHGDDCRYVTEFTLDITDTTDQMDIARMLFNIYMMESIFRTIVTTITAIADLEQLDDTFSPEVDKLDS